MTRENYLNLEYMGKPPKQLHPEMEQELPGELQAPDDTRAEPLSEFYRILLILSEGT